MSPDGWAQMFNEYKEIISKKPSSKWKDFTITMPSDWAHRIAERVPQYG